MQRKTTGKLLLTGIGYMFFGNILATVMSIAIAVIIDRPAIQVIATFFTAFIFLSMMFVAGYKDGSREEQLLKLKRVESVDMNRWVKLGGILWAIMCVFPLLMLLFIAIGQFDFIIWLRWICGALYPLSLLIGGNDSSLFPIYMPIIYIAFYALIPLACQIGFKAGYSQTFENKDFMYKK